MKDQAAKMWYLKKIDFVEKVNDEIIDRLGDVSHMDDIKEGEMIFLPGDIAKNVYLLKDGRVQLSRQDSNGRRITLTILEHGDIFGETTLTDEQERKTFAESLTDAVVCKINKENFLDVVKDHPEFHLRVTRMINERKTEIESRVENLIFRDSRESMAYCLQDLFENHSEDSKGIKNSEIEFTHQQLADLAGLTRPVATKILNEFADEEIIELGHKKIHLENPRRLSNLAEAE